MQLTYITFGIKLNSSRAHTGAFSKSIGVNCRHIDNTVYCNYNW